MAEELDWNEEIASFDANAALTEARILWLKLGRHFVSVAESYSDFFEDPAKDGDAAIRWAARAEACLWRATGDSNAIDAEQFITPTVAEKGE